MTLLEGAEAIKKTGFCPGKMYQLLDPETIGGFQTLPDRPWHDVDYIDDAFVFYRPGDYFMVCSINYTPNTNHQYTVRYLHKYKLRDFLLSRKSVNRFRQYFKEVN